MRDGSLRHVVGAQDVSEEGQVMGMGAMKDGRCDKGPEGMG